MTHIDDWIDRTIVSDEERYATFFFMLHRLDALSQVKWAPWISKYTLFCTYQGQRYRVTGCSRLGDVWLVSRFSQEHSYDLRVDVADCSVWTEKP